MSDSQNEGPRATPSGWFHQAWVFWGIFLFIPAVSAPLAFIKDLGVSTAIWFVLWVPCTLGCGYWLAARRSTEFRARLLWTLLFSALLGPAITALTALGCALNILPTPGSSL